MIEELPPELSDLIAAERSTPVVAPIAHAAARAKLAAAVAKLAPLGHVAGLGAAGKALAVLAVVVGAGVATKMIGNVAPPYDGDPAAYFDPSMAKVARVMMRTSSAGEVGEGTPAAAVGYTDSPVSSAPRTDGLTAVADGKLPSVLPRVDSIASPSPISGSTTRMTARTLSPGALQSAPSEGSSPEMSRASRSTDVGEAVATASRSSRDNATPRARTTDVPTVTSTTPTEAQLLHAAWTTRDPARALALVHQDAQLHPDGPLAEERAAIEAIALASLHQVDDARAAATRFYSLYPNSTHRALVERAVERTP